MGTPSPSPFRTRPHLRWADIDANFHLRHSVYYDLCAQQRMDALRSVGVTLETMKEHHFGPVIFREECIFRREIKLDDEVYLDVALSQLTRDYGRFAFRHTFTKADGTYCATSNMEGAWMDTRLRKLTTPPTIAAEGMDRLPRTPDFSWL